MKRRVTRIAALMLALLMLAGCKDGSVNDTSGGVMDAAPPDFVYVPEAIPLPDGIGQVFGNCIAITADRIFIAASESGQDGETDGYSYYFRLYSMIFDGSDFTELANYTPPRVPVSVASGWSRINAICADSDGNLWISEQWQFGRYDLPDSFDTERHNLEDYEYIDHGSGTAMRKLDRTGAELLSVDLSGISGNREDFLIQSLSIDGTGNVYMAIMDYSSGGSIIFVLGNDGNLLFQLDTGGRQVDRLILMPDGRVAFTDGGASSQILRTIDADAKAFGSTINIPGIVQNARIHPGNGEFDLLASDTNSLYGFSTGADEPVKLLSWSDVGLQPEGMEHIVLLPGGRILCSSNAYDQRANEFKAEIVILEAKPRSELPEETEKTVLTLATLYAQRISHLVNHFNRENPDYEIEVTDYSEGGRAAGLTRLSTEIIAGKIPDILDVTYMPYIQYISKGLLADLYPLIDSDPNINRGDLIEGALRAAEIDGRLYVAFPSFSVRAIAGHPSAIGTGFHWTLDEFRAAIDAHPDADLPLGQITKRSFLQAAILHKIDEYADWGKGTANFDSDEFISLLRYSNSLPTEYDHSSLNPVELVRSGRQIMAYEYFRHMNSFQIYKSMFGGDIAIKGFPANNSSGITLAATTMFAIAADSKNMDGAWEFIRFLFDEKRPLASYEISFPTNKAAFDAYIEEAIYDSQNMDVSSSWGYSDGSHYSITIRPITQEDVDQLISMIDAAAEISIEHEHISLEVLKFNMEALNISLEIWNIISEGASDYFNGVCSAEEAAKIIQSRASILVSEQRR